jgi:hypothetical protein
VLTVEKLSPLGQRRWSTQLPVSGVSSVTAALAHYTLYVLGAGYQRSVVRAVSPVSGPALWQVSFAGSEVSGFAVATRSLAASAPAGRSLLRPAIPLSPARMVDRVSCLALGWTPWRL